MNNTLYRDMLMLMLMAFVAMVVLMLPVLNPPANEANIDPPGNLIVTITWPPGDTDVDLWVDGPGELAPVGYSNTSGLLWNLLRDDLGTFLDTTGINYENAYTRGIISGDYVINVHCFRCNILPQRVEVEISVQREDVKGVDVIATTNVALSQNGQELTALRFSLTRDGDLVPGSMHHVFKPLRSATDTGGEFQ